VSDHPAAWFGLVVVVVAYAVLVVVGLALLADSAPI